MRLELEYFSEYEGMSSADILLVHYCNTTPHHTIHLILIHDHCE